MTNTGLPREAWIAIAVAYETPHEERTEHQRRLAQDGLCHAASRRGRGFTDSEEWSKQVVTIQRQ
jgi:hypothetical protein